MLEVQCECVICWYEKTCIFQTVTNQIELHALYYWKCVLQYIILSSVYFFVRFCFVLYFAVGFLLNWTFSLYSPSLDFCAATKTVLNGINGEFRAGELSTIVGPSGAGKSTLLDILTGYTTKIASGTIKINGRCRDLRRFRRQVAYIMQDCELQMHITVWEAMYFSVNLKIGPQLKLNEKKDRVSAVWTEKNNFNKWYDL